MYELQLSLAGGRIQADTFLEGVSVFLKLLKSVDASLSGKETIVWALQRLTYSSPATVGFTGEPKKNSADNTRLIGAAVIEGLEALDRGSQSRPKGFEDNALKFSQRLSQLRGRGGVLDLIVMDLNGTRSNTVHISGRVAVSVEEFIGPRFESIGMLEGKLEVLSSHGGMKCQIYERRTGKPVRCLLPQEMKRAAVDAFDENVMVRGRVWRDASGQPRLIEVQELQKTPEEQTVESLAGIDPDITGGMDVAEFLKKRWE